jgi:hypothetical protein
VIDGPRARGPWVWVAGGAGVLALLGVLAALLGLGPFREPELTRGELIARGDEICRKAHQAFADLQRQPPRTASEAAELMDHLIGIAGDEVDQIESLNGPPEFDDQIEDYVAAREEGIDAMRAGRDAAADRDSKAYADSQAEVAAGQRERHRSARRIGFAVCSRPLKLAGG